MKSLKELPCWRLKDLPCWREAHELEKILYEHIRHRNPADFLRVQIERAGNSVPANIAEGFGYKSDKVLIKHLNIALGSLSEIESHLESLKIRVPEHEIGEAVHKINSVRQSVLGFKRYLRSD